MSNHEITIDMTDFLGTFLAFSFYAGMLFVSVHVIPCHCRFGSKEISKIC